VTAWRLKVCGNLGDRLLLYRKFDEGYDPYSLDFDGTSDLVYRHDAALELNASSLTLAAWIKADAWKANRCEGTIISKESTSTERGYMLRTGLAAREALGVERAADGQLTVLIEIDSEHCATCYADGIQMTTTGCTFGMGNIRKLGYGISVLTLVDNRAGRSVRVATRNEINTRNQESGFIQHRKRGVPVSKIDPGLVEPWQRHPDHGERDKAACGRASVRAALR